MPVHSELILVEHDASAPALLTPIIPRSNISVFENTRPICSSFLAKRTNLHIAARGHSPIPSPPIPHALSSLGESRNHFLNAPLHPAHWLYILRALMTVRIPHHRQLEGMHLAVVAASFCEMRFAEPCWPIALGLAEGDGLVVLRKQLCS